jgi:hypothetical protein
LSPAHRLHHTIDTLDFKVQQSHRSTDGVETRRRRGEEEEEKAESRTLQNGTFSVKRCDYIFLSSGFANSMECAQYQNEQTGFAQLS